LVRDESQLPYGTLFQDALQALSAAKGDKRRYRGSYLIHLQGSRNPFVTRVPD
jgi:hypothetical protein